MDASFLRCASGNRLAYIHIPGSGKGALLPTVMFCPGFASDMQGTKALYLEQACRARGQGFFRFDYSGHGQSGGRFEDGTISLWTNEAKEILNVVDGPVILAGSSMGGWIALNLAQTEERVHGLVGIAAAPDFTRVIKAKMSALQKAGVQHSGLFHLPSHYGPEPYVITQALLEDGEAQCLLDRRIRIRVPVCLIQGKRDTDVDWHTPDRIRTAFKYPEHVEIILVEDGDHRLSRTEDLELIWRQVEKISEKIIS